MKIIKTLIFVGFIAIAGCLDNNPQQDFLDVKRGVWNTVNIDTYTYTLGETSLGVQRADILVEVVNGVVDSAFAQPGRIALSNLSDIETIEDLFDIIQDQINSNAISLNVTYHPDYGFPEEINVDPDNELIDDEFSFEAKDFTH